MAFTDNAPKNGDTDNNLLMKIAGSLTGGGINVNVVGDPDVVNNLELLVVAAEDTATTLALNSITPEVTQYPISSPAGTGQVVVLGSVNRSNGPVSFRYSPGDTDFLATIGSGGTLTNASSGFFGMQITPAAPLIVTQLGRARLAGNSQVHQMKIIDASTGLTVQGSQVLIDMAVGTVNTFTYVALAAPVPLAAGQPYYILSSEVIGGDFWLDGQIVVGTAAATIGQRVYIVDEFVTMAGVQRRDTAGSLVDANGDRTELQVDASGRLRVTTLPELIDISAQAPTAATVGVASAAVLANTPTRKGLILTNTSANVISLAFGNTAVLNSGVTLAAGESFKMDAYSFTVDSVAAIASVAGSNLAIQQYD